MTYKGIATATPKVTTTASTINVPYPTGGAKAVAGEALVCIVANDSATPATLPAGWTPGISASGTGAQTPSLRVFGIVATGSETGNLTVTVGNVGAQAVMISVTGDFSAGFDVTGKTVSPSASTTLNIPGLTPGQANDTLLIGGTSATATGSFSPSASLTGFTEVYDVAAANTVALAVDVLEYASASATGTVVLTRTTSIRSVGFMVAIKPSVTSVTSTRATTWNVLAPVTSTRATTWDVLTPATSTRATTWDVKTAVTSTRATTWNVRAAVTSSRVASWNVLAALSSTRATTWNVLSALSSTRSTTWVVRAAVTSTRATTWDVGGPVTSTRSTTWNVRAAITSTRVASWNTLAVVTSTRATTWDVAAPLTIVTSTRSTTWNVRAAITSTRSTTWDVRVFVTSTRDTTWIVLAAVTSIRTALWVVLLTVTSSRTTTWDVFAPPPGEPVDVPTLRIAVSFWSARLDPTEARVLSIDPRTAVLSTDLSLAGA